MKLTKRMFGTLLAMVMVLAMSVTAFAAGNTITIHQNPEDKGTHTYQAYQLFTGDLTEQDGKKILSNITWGSGVDTTKLSDLATDINNLSNPQGTLTAASSAADFAKAITDLNAQHDDATAQAVADAFSKVLSATVAGSGSDKIENLDPGYYLVKDTDGSQDGKEDAAYTRYILEVVSDVTVDVKSEVPSVDKKIKEGEQKLSANSASIGDEINYEVTSKVPDMTGYEKYFFVLNDTMSKGLTFNDDVKVKIGDTELDADDYEVESVVNQDGTTSIKIVLKDFIQYKDQKDAAITVTYTATLNEQADLTETGNVNEVQLTYSNNPNYDYNGDPNHPDEPGPDEPTGETPKSTTKTFTTEVQLTKVDAADAAKKLTGAKFSIAGEKANVTLINEEVFEEAEDGTWYMLKDGTYTETAPTTGETGNEASYDSTTKKYKKVEHVTEEVTKEQVTAEGYVDENGVLTFTGLNAGTYTITELVAPDGYNLLDNPIELVITGTLDQDDKTCTWSAKVDNEDATIEDNVIKLTVENNMGSTLPTTGGIGTTIFYVCGLLLVLLAGVALVVRRRVSFSRR